MCHSRPAFATIRTFSIHESALALIHKKITSLISFFRIHIRHNFLVIFYLKQQFYPVYFNLGSGAKPRRQLKRIYSRAETHIILTRCVGELLQTTFFDFVPLKYKIKITNCDAFQMSVYVVSSCCSCIQR